MFTYWLVSCDQVWPSGKALVRMVSRGTSVRIRVGSPFSSKVVYGQSCDFVPHNKNTHNKMALIVAHPNTAVIVAATV